MSLHELAVLTASVEAIVHKAYLERLESTYELFGIFFASPLNAQDTETFLMLRLGRPAELDALLLAERP